MVTWGTNRCRRLLMILCVVYFCCFLPSFFSPLALGTGWLRRCVHGGGDRGRSRLRLGPAHRVCWPHGDGRVPVRRVCDSGRLVLAFFFFFFRILFCYSGANCTQTNTGLSTHCTTDQWRDWNADVSAAPGAAAVQGRAPGGMRATAHCLFDPQRRSAHDGARVPRPSGARGRRNGYAYISIGFRLVITRSFVFLWSYFFFFFFFF
jgi:hypothetical protein